MGEGGMSWLDRQVKQRLLMVPGTKDGSSGVEMEHVPKQHASDANQREERTSHGPHALSTHI